MICRMYHNCLQKQTPNLTQTLYALAFEHRSMVYPLLSSPTRLLSRAYKVAFLTEYLIFDWDEGIKV